MIFCFFVRILSCDWCSYPDFLLRQPSLHLLLCILLSPTSTDASMHRCLLLLVYTYSVSYWFFPNIFAVLLSYLCCYVYRRLRCADADIARLACYVDCDSTILLCTVIVVTYRFKLPVLLSSVVTDLSRYAAHVSRDVLIVNVTCVVVITVMDMICGHHPWLCVVCHSHLPLLTHLF